MQQQTQCTGASQRSRAAAASNAISVASEAPPTAVCKQRDRLLFRAKPRRWLVCLSRTQKPAMGSSKWSRAGGDAGPLPALKLAHSPPPLSTIPPANVRLTTRHALLLHPPGCCQGNSLFHWRSFLRRTISANPRTNSRPRAVVLRAPGMFLNIENPQQNKRVDYYIT